MHDVGSSSPNPHDRPSRRTENRHTKDGATCHHFQRYRITCAEYDDLRARAGGRCEICKRDENEVPGEALIIDHVHDRESLIIRGLVCARCNSVMACHDGTKKWGPSSLMFADKARTYHERALARTQAAGGER
ncbi:endonuclease domain-containing protein [Streptomyces antimycoticus]|uniref:endonuclease domain-containing protein n=1 Tax=Streptomyces antimycoticus TaxID=68175 RepID=UPI0036EFBF73